MTVCAVPLLLRCTCTYCIKQVNILQNILCVFCVRAGGKTRELCHTRMVTSLKLSCITAWFWYHQLCGNCVDLRSCENVKLFVNTTMLNELYAFCYWIVTNCILNIGACYHVCSHQFLILMVVNAFLFDSIVCQCQMSASPWFSIRDNGCDCKDSTFFKSWLIWSIMIFCKIGHH